MLHYGTAASVLKVTPDDLATRAFSAEVTDISAGMPVPCKIPGTFSRLGRTSETRNRKGHAAELAHGFVQGHSKIRKLSRYHECKLVLIVLRMQRRKLDVIWCGYHS